MLPSVAPYTLGPNTASCCNIGASPGTSADALVPVSAVSVSATTVRAVPSVPCVEWTSDVVGQGSTSGGVSGNAADRS